MAQGGASPGGGRPAVRRFLARRPVAIAARLVLGGVFIYAAYGRLGNPRAFADAIDNYRLLPDSLVSLAVVTLPWVEIAVGALLVIGLLAPGAALLGGSLLVVYTIALVAALARRLDIACGCFAVEGGATISWTDVLVRIALLALGLEALVASHTVDWPIVLIKDRRTQSPPRAHADRSQPA
jgi:uncharacterized membrane protein YphA (DoxX/SURF4 family)